jgi:outer membrane protein assembly factor BamB
MGRRNFMHARSWLVLLAVVFIVGCSQNKITTLSFPVLTQHNDEMRSGVQLDTVLNTSNVHQGSFGKLFTRTLPMSPNSTSLLKDRIYTQPLLISPSIVIVATDTNMVYAFDARNAAASAPLWTANLGPPESAIDNWTNDPHCSRSLPVIGVLGTPVIPTDEKVLYVVSKNRLGAKSSKAASFTIHELNTSNGQELAHAQISLDGFLPYYQLQRPGLVFVPRANAPGGGFVYAAFGGHCDARPPTKGGGDYHGWLIGFDGNLGKQVEAFNTTPDGWGGGIWQAGQAPVYISEGCPKCRDMLYVSTGNGSGKLANSVLKLQVGPTGDLTLVDSFTPYNQTALNNCDADMASTGPVLLSDYNHLVVGGKEGVLYILKTDNLGHGVAKETQANLTGTQSPHDSCQHTNGGGGFNDKYTWNPQGDAVFQEFAAVVKHQHTYKDESNQAQTEYSFGHIHGAPVYARIGGPSPSLRFYIWPEMDNLKQFREGSGFKFNPTPEKESTVKSFEGMPGGMLSISSAGGGQPGAGDVLVWATHPKADAWAPDRSTQSPSVPLPVDGILYAFDGADVSKNLWNSDLRPQDHLGEFSKFAPPTIANGRVYVATFSGELQVYGLCGVPSSCE